MKIGFVGPGRMGRSMLDRLVAAGHHVTVLVRRPEARAAAEAGGLTCAGTVGPHDIAVGRLTLWVGGDQAVLAETRPVLEAYASPIKFAARGYCRWTGWGSVRSRAPHGQQF